MQRGFSVCLLPFCFDKCCYHLVAEPRNRKCRGPGLEEESIAGKGVGGTAQQLNKHSRLCPKAVQSPE